MHGAVADSWIFNWVKGKHRMKVDPVHLFLSLSSETVFEFAATASKAICSGFLA